MTKSTVFREMTTQERRVLERLLSSDFPGREVLDRQIRDALVRQIDDEGSLEFSVRSHDRAEVSKRIPTEAEFEDADGVTAHILLHVVDGKCNELEIYKDDSTPITIRPEPENLRLVC